MASAPIVLLGCALVLDACAGPGEPGVPLRGLALSSALELAEPLGDGPAWQGDAATSEAGAGASPKVSVHDIQGHTHRSPYEGRVVTVDGAVTVARDNGFWLAEETPDQDDATSEGLFVFTDQPPTVQAGARVRVTGEVTEYRPGCARCDEQNSAHDNLTITEITRVSALETLAASVPLPAPVRLGPGGRMPPQARMVAADSSGDVERQGRELDPLEHGLDFFESLEGMRVLLPEPVATGPTLQLGHTQEVVLALPGARSRLSARGGLLWEGERKNGDQQPERFFVSSALCVDCAFPALDVGDGFAGELVAVVDYGYGRFVLLPSELPAVSRGGLLRERVQLPRARGRVLDVATLNVENLGGNAPEARFDELARALVDELGAPDLVALEEVQDDSGAADDGVTASALTVSRLVAAVEALDGPSYDYYDIAPEDGADGGQPGGNIRVGLMVRSDRGLTFIARSGGDAITKTRVYGERGLPWLSHSPGRVEPGAEAFAASRKPLVAELEFAGERLFVVANHFSSKRGDDPTFGRVQPPVPGSEPKRLQQAALVRDFVARILAMDARALVLVLGDLNDLPGSPTLRSLTVHTGLSDLYETLPAAQRYSYVFQGVAQALDHILVSRALRERAVALDVVHRNAEFAAQLSDHDPLVARFAFPEPSRKPPGAPLRGVAVPSTASAKTGATPRAASGCAVLREGQGRASWTPGWPAPLVFLWRRTRRVRASKA